LFREHNYNPLGGCLLALVQLPIFVGLYSSLRGDVELRQAPLISENVRWASNLAAPDMLWNWTGVVPEFVSHGTGFLGLGPYFNLLPLLTIGLFIWQQKMFMPPPTDEQQALQQKMMQYMMIVVAIMFFKVPSGLGVYLITSSLWGIAERKLLGKMNPAAAPATAAAAAMPSAGSGGAGGRRRQKGRK
jgi:YidC/Oxa1 family membrane protein insertase